MYKYKLFEILATNVLPKCNVSVDILHGGLQIIQLLLSLKAFGYAGDFQEVYALFESSGCLDVVESL